MTEISKVFLNEMKTDIEDDVIYADEADQIDILMDDSDGEMIDKVVDGN